jgi:broad specificity phosphatase PhoE
MMTEIKYAMRTAVLGMVVGLLAFTAAQPETHADLSDKELVDALRRGGYNIYFRHAATDWSANDQVVEDGDWKSCDARRMRQLSERGRKQARRIGEAIRRLQIPVGRVVSSEYCRARQTAQFMNLGRVETSRAIMNIRAASFVGGEEKLVQRARHLLSLPPAKGTNAIFVAHGNLMRATSGAYTDEAGAVILAPHGDGNIVIIAVIDPEHWEILACQFGLSGNCNASSP